MPSPPATDSLRCSLHDWTTLRERLVFVYDGPIPTGASDGVYTRRGEYSAWKIRQGWARVECNGFVAEATEGQWLFCFGERLDQRLSPDVRLLSLRIANCWPDNGLLFDSRNPLLVLSAADHPELETIAGELISDVGRVEWRNDHPAYTFQWRTRLGYESYLQHQRHLLDWMQAVARIMRRDDWTMRIPSGVDPRLAHALNLIDNRPISAPFPKNQLPGSGLSLGRINRMCVQTCQTTLFAYWEARRIEHARFLLDQPGASIKQTASALGFTQLSHFSAWFKRHFGDSPRSHMAKQHAQAG